MKGDEFLKLAARKPPFSKMHPKVAAFFQDYLSHEKVIRFGALSVVNTHFPPYPSAAFDNLVEQFNVVGDALRRRLFSVTLAVTNRCDYKCWHCYNAGRSQQDIPLALLRETIRALQDMGAVMVTLSGGEPLLRDDLEEIAASFDQRTCLNLNTTGAGLTLERARRLKESGLFAAGVSLDSIRPEEHDRMRGRSGAFQTALDALRMISESGLYPYIIAVATREFLQPGHFRPFMEFAAQSGALEVHLLEPCATGNLAGNTDALLHPPERDMILEYQKEVARDESLPVLSTFLHLESPEAFGCGAGLTHLYIDGSGEVCPCNLVPLSFGNVTREPLARILDRMAQHFVKPRPACVGRILSRHAEGHPLPTSPEISDEICRKYLPREHALPRFFQVRSEAREVGAEELRSAYNTVHEHYDEFWVKEAGKPVEDLIGRLRLSGTERVFEAGCGTGFATVRLAARLGGDGGGGGARGEGGRGGGGTIADAQCGQVLAVDLSEGMLGEARARAQACGAGNVRFAAGDALEWLGDKGPFDLVFSSWVLGYIPLKPFFGAASRALARDGRLAFIVHKENSPREPLEIFAELVARDPSVLLKKVAFDFPRDSDHVRAQLAAAGLEPEQLWEGGVPFEYASPDQVLEHLLKSGAGTAFHDAVDPQRRQALEQEFLRILASRHVSPAAPYQVLHDFVACIARKTG